MIRNIINLHSLGTTATSLLRQKQKSNCLLLSPRKEEENALGGMTGSLPGLGRLVYLLVTQMLSLYIIDY